MGIDFGGFDAGMAELRPEWHECICLSQFFKIFLTSRTGCEKHVHAARFTPNISSAWSAMRRKRSASAFRYWLNSSLNRWRSGSLSVASYSSQRWSTARRASAVLAAARSAKYVWKSKAVMAQSVWGSSCSSECNRSASNSSKRARDSSSSST